MFYSVNSFTVYEFPLSLSMSAGYGQLCGQL